MARTGDGFEEVWVNVGEASLCALINGAYGWLMYLREEGDSGFSSRNPDYDGPPSAMIEYYLENGQARRVPGVVGVPGRRRATCARLLPARGTTATLHRVARGVSEGLT